MSQHPRCGEPAPSADHPGYCDLKPGHDQRDKWGGTEAHAIHDSDGRFVFGWGDLEASESGSA